MIGSKIRNADLKHNIQRQLIADSLTVASIKLHRVTKLKVSEVYSFSEIRLEKGATRASNRNDN